MSKLRLLLAAAVVVLLRVNALDSFQFSDELIQQINSYKTAIEFYISESEQLKHMYNNILLGAVNRMSSMSDLEKLSFYAVFDQQAAHFIQSSQEQRIKDIQIAFESIRLFDEPIFAQLLILKILKLPFENDQFKTIIEMYEIVLQKETLETLYEESLEQFVSEFNIHADAREIQAFSQEIIKSGHSMDLVHMFMQNLANRIHKSIGEAQEHIVSIQKFRAFILRLQESMAKQQKKDQEEEMEEWQNELSQEKRKDAQPIDDDL